MTDKIVEEIHAVRRTICEECGYDFQKLGEYYMQLQAKHPERMRYDVPKVQHVTSPTDEKPA